MSDIDWEVWTENDMKAEIEHLTDSQTKLEDTVSKISQQSMRDVSRIAKLEGVILSSIVWLNQGSMCNSDPPYRDMVNSIDYYTPPRTG